MYRKDRAGQHARAAGGGRCRPAGRHPGAAAAGVLGGPGARAPGVGARRAGARLRGARRARPALVERLAAALADLHGAGARRRGRRRISPRTSAAPASPAARPWRPARPNWADDLRAIEAAMYSLERTFGRTLRPCHGDFSPRQLFVAPHAVYMVDLDGMSHRRGGAGRGRASGSGSRRTWARRAGASASASWPRTCSQRGLAALPALPAYEAFSELRRAMTLWRKRPPGLGSRLAARARRGRARLAASAPPPRPPPGLRKGSADGQGQARQEGKQRRKQLEEADVAVRLPGLQAGLAHLRARPLPALAAAERRHPRHDPLGGHRARETVAAQARLRLRAARSAAAAARGLAGPLPGQRAGAAPAAHLRPDRRWWPPPTPSSAT